MWDYTKSGKNFLVQPFAELLCIRPRSVPLPCHCRAWPDNLATVHMLSGAERGSKSRDIALHVFVVWKLFTCRLRDTQQTSVFLFAIAKSRIEFNRQKAPLLQSKTGSLCTSPRPLPLYTTAYFLGGCSSFKWKTQKDEGVLQKSRLSFCKMLLRVIMIYACGIVRPRQRKKLWKLCRKYLTQRNTAS